SKKKVLKARLFASALGVFEVYMNGQRLGASKAVTKPFILMSSRNLPRRTSGIEASERWFASNSLYFGLLV
ncbi:MAG: alpha-L-rhamnosidase N-terminal domain-containing protein, partial [Bacteroidales bacterium]|nr:alpha-L-rhamnosidase N-terminal domain-containing protein [Bacteroidales bacterium]